VNEVETEVDTAKRLPAAPRPTPTGINDGPNRTVSVPAAPLEDLRRGEALASLHGKHVQLLKTQAGALDAKPKAARARDERHAEALMRIMRDGDDRVDGMQARHAAALRDKDQSASREESGSFSSTVAVPYPGVVRSP
jgi:hypothetical protein